MDDRTHIGGSWVVPTLVERIVTHLLELLCEQIAQSHQRHYCALLSPCPTILPAVSMLLNLRLVSSAWNRAALRVSNKHPLFCQVEEAYYPHPWHINSKVRRTVILQHYRVYRTIATENGDRGVFLAFDFGGPDGCSHVEEVVVKAWVSRTDPECTTEETTYQKLQGPSRDVSIVGVPKILANGWDATCEVYAIVMQKLGPNLQDILEVSQFRKFDERMTMAVAIQMLNRYRDIHSRGVIHNGIKPANICISSPSSKQSNCTLHVIDFGLSYHFDISTANVLPGRIETVGNRRFLSLFAHHGIGQSRRDDLESLAYLLSFLHHGYLPWDKPYIPSSSEDSQPHIWRRKMATPASVLFSGMDPTYVAFFKDVKSLAFAEVPNYDEMEARFVARWRTRGFQGQPGEVAWSDIWNSSNRKGLDDKQTATHDSSPFSQPPTVSSVQINIPSVLDASQTEECSISHLERRP